MGDGGAERTSLSRNLSSTRIKVMKLGSGKQLIASEILRQAAAHWLGSASRVLILLKVCQPCVLCGLRLLTCLGAAWLPTAPYARAVIPGMRVVVWDGKWDRNGGCFQVVVEMSVCRVSGGES